jgi:hypothetical protein
LKSHQLKDCGFRVAAADASKLQLFLKDANGRKDREAVAFMTGNEMALDFELYSPEVSERQMLSALRAP